MSTELFADTPSAPGFLVTIDGPNGSGKTSLAAEIVRMLAGTAADVHSTCQPSPSALGGLVRDAEASLRGPALACLVAADRHNQLATEIGPALARGAIVVCDRYIESSLVLQRIDGVDTAFIIAVNRGVRRPDLRVRLLAAEDVLRARLVERGGRDGRRFEGMPDGPAGELALYEEADALLADLHGLPALVLDTTASTAPEQARRVVLTIRQRLTEGR